MTGEVLQINTMRKHELIQNAVDTAKIIHMSDAGHGWYSVPVSLLKLLEIDDQVSGSSYLKGKRAYLEEDADGSLLINAIRKYYPDFRAETRHVDRQSPIRNYGIYDKELAELNLKDPNELIGMKLYQASSVYTIENYRKPFFFVTQDGGSQKYRVNDKDLSKYFITEEMKRRDKAIKFIHDFLKEKLEGLPFHFYTTDNLTLPVNSLDNDNNPNKIHLDYTISNENVGTLKINSLSFKKVIVHGDFISTAKELAKAPLKQDEIQKILDLL